MRNTPISLEPGLPPRYRRKQQGCAKVSERTGHEGDGTFPAIYARGFFPPSCAPDRRPFHGQYHVKKIMINAKAGHLLIKLHQDEREELLDETAMKGQAE